MGDRAGGAGAVRASYRGTLLEPEGLEDAQGLAEEAEGEDHHKHAEADPYHVLGQPVPYADAYRGADYGSDDEGWQAQELLRVPEAGSDVPCGPHDAGEHDDGEARGDGLFRGKAHAQHHKRHHHHPAADTHEPRYRPDKNSHEEDQGESDVFVAVVAAPAAGGRVGEGQKQRGEGHLHHDLGGDPAYENPDQGRRRDRQRQQAGHPPVHRIVAPGIANSARERTENNDNQARRNGLLDTPPTSKQKPRHEYYPATNPDEPREHPPDDPDNPEEQKF